MSQYPSPYQPPQYQQPGYGYAPPQQDPRTPARQAGLLMMILGAIVVLCGGCMILIGAALPSLMSKMPPEQTQMIQDLENSTHLSAGTMFIGIGIAMLVFSVLTIVVGALVRGGGLGWIITGIVITVLTLLWLLLNTIGSLLQGGLGAACFALLMIGAFGWLLILLIQAARASGKARNMQAQYQQQYFAYMQAMHQYNQTGYGYGYPTAPPPAPSVPPTPDASQSQQNPPDAPA